MFVYMTRMYSLSSLTTNKEREREGEKESERGREGGGEEREGQKDGHISLLAFLY